jgi:hypothetical protein
MATSATSVGGSRLQALFGHDVIEAVCAYLSVGDILRLSETGKEAHAVVSRRASVPLLPPPISHSGDLSHNLVDYFFVGGARASSLALAGQEPPAVAPPEPRALPCRGLGLEARQYAREGRAVARLLRRARSGAAQLEPRAADGPAALAIEQARRRSVGRERTAVLTFPYYVWFKTV